MSFYSSAVVRVTADGKGYPAQAVWLSPALVPAELSSHRQGRHWAVSSRMAKRMLCAPTSWGRTDLVARARCCTVRLEGRAGRCPCLAVLPLPVIDRVSASAGGTGVEGQLAAALSPPPKLSAVTAERSGRAIPNHKSRSSPLRRFAPQPALGLSRAITDARHTAGQAQSSRSVRDLCFGTASPSQECVRAGARR
jgi:hypothetical protein